MKTTPLCTWVGCTATPEEPQVAKDGTTWANLCEKHHGWLEAEIKSGDPERIMQVWIRAQGGASVAVKKMMG